MSNEPYEMLPEYSTVLMTDIWDTAAEFVLDYQTIGIPTIISTQSVTTLYYLLYARYANNPLANRDPEQFRYKTFALVWQYGPTWEKRLDIQAKLRALQDTDLVKGPVTSIESEGEVSGEDSTENTDTTVTNHAYNPGTAPSSQTYGELNYIDQQQAAKKTASVGTTSSQSDSRSNTQTITKSKMDAYAQLWDLLDTDVTSEFLDKFKKLFKQFVAPERPLLYVTDLEEEDD